MKSMQIIWTMISGFLGGAGLVAILAAGGMKAEGEAASRGIGGFQSPSVHRAALAPEVAAVPAQWVPERNARPDLFAESRRWDRAAVEYEVDSPSTAAAVPGSATAAATGLPARSETSGLTEEAPEPKESTRIRVPQGVLLEADLEAPVSSRTARVGDPVHLRLVRDVIVDGVVAVPEGSRVRGVVRDVRPAGRIKGNGSISLAFTELTLPGGESTALSGRFEQTAEGKTKRDAGIIGGSAAGGALLGQILGEDTESTLGGAVLGGAVGTGVVLANKGRDLELEAGQRLVFQTETELELPVPAS